MPEFDAQWRGRSDFAEVAEALGVKTDQIAAYSPTEMVVLWTPVEGDTLLWRGRITRDAIGLMQVVEREPAPGLWEDILAYTEGKMTERFGKPKDG